ncbi:hypothetical protein [Dialister succinatiphilus]|uniref:hypothetical protein n=1 Tax=Dialister succinatiphilus TaxID=487173 RepID=UPI0040281592
MLADYVSFLWKGKVLLLKIILLFFIIISAVCMLIHATYQRNVIYRIPNQNNIEYSEIINAKGGPENITIKATPIRNTDLINITMRSHDPNVLKVVGDKFVIDLKNDLQNNYMYNLESKELGQLLTLINQKLDYLKSGNENELRNQINGLEENINKITAPKVTLEYDTGVISKPVFPPSLFMQIIIAIVGACICWILIRSYLYIRINS